MRLAVIIVIAVAALFAGAVFYFLLQYMENVERNAITQAQLAKPGIDAVEILVADTDMPAGTVIDSNNMDWRAWPDEDLGGGYVVYREDDGDDQSDLEEPYYDQIVRRTILAGEPITEAKLFTRAGSSFLSGMLTPGMRAVAIKVQDVTGVGGFILPGDRVDVIVSLKWKIDQDAREKGAPFTEFTSETIVQNARVLGIDQAFDDFEENVSKASAVTIEVTPKQAEIIAVAKRKGDLSLSLRSLVPDPVGAIAGFTSDREVLYAMGGGFPASERLAQPVIVAGAGSGEGESSGSKQMAGIQTFRAMTARRDLPKGSLLRESDVEWAALPADRRPEDYVIQGREAVTPAFLRGVLLNKDTRAGEPLPFGELYTDTNAEYLGLALRAGMRAIKIVVRKKTFSGTPGDEVDIVLISEIDKDQPFSETIMQKVRVLSIAAQEDGAVIEVTPKQFETLALAQAMGDLQLSLRSNLTTLADIYEGAYTSKLDVSRAISGVIMARAQALAEAEAAAAATAAEESAAALKAAAAATAAKMSAAALKAAAEMSAAALKAAEEQAMIDATRVVPEPKEEEVHVEHEEEEAVTVSPTVKVYRSTTSTQQSFSQ